MRRSGMLSGGLKHPIIVPGEKEHTDEYGGVE